MKKVIIALLVVAAAGTAYYLYTRTSTKTDTATLNKELLTGKWKPANSIPVADTTSPHQYEFKGDGLLLLTVSDTAKADTLHYAWDKSNALVWKKQATDTTGTVYNIVQLTSDTLALKATTLATEMLLTRVK